VKILRASALCLACAALLAGAPAAMAGNVEFDGSTLTFTAGAGEVNNVTLHHHLGTFTLTDFDTDPTETSASCTDNGNNITCTRSGSTLIRVLLGDAADFFSAADGDLVDRIELFGGGDSDGLFVNTATAPGHLIEGGDGDDGLQAAHGANTLRGGAGEDQIDGGSGSDAIEGGADDDTFQSNRGTDDYRGGDGFDQLRIICFESTCEAPISVTLDDQPDDGAPGQASNVHSDVEDVTGSNRGDSLRGSQSANVLMGRRGPDTIDGLGGADVLSGETGDDEIRARDGVRDVVRCGPDADTVTADTFDLVESDCESVSRPAPETTITSGPEGSTSDTTPEFGFSSSDQGATFQCRVDGEEFRACGSPTTTGPLAFGQHTFEVRAVDSLGNPDQTPASRTLTVALLPGRCANPLAGTGRSDELNGTPAGDRIRGRGGADIVNGGAGADCLFGDAGADILSGGSGGDTISGGAGNDNIGAGQGKDRVVAGAGNDTIDAADGRPERINCGAGRDKVGADRSDRLRGCERVTRRRR
jgi:Ca2+-binding RTX toxin-like protein